MPHYVIRSLILMQLEMMNAFVFSFYCCGLPPVSPILSIIHSFIHLTFKEKAQGALHHSGSGRNIEVVVKSNTKVADQVWKELPAFFFP